MGKSWTQSTMMSAMLWRMLLSLLRIMTGSVLLNTLVHSAQNFTFSRTDAASVSSTRLMNVASV